MVQPKHKPVITISICARDMELPLRVPVSMRGEHLAPLIEAEFEISPLCLHTLGNKGRRLGIAKDACLSLSLSSRCVYLSARTRTRDILPNLVPALYKLLALLMSSD